MSEKNTPTAKLEAALLHIAELQTANEKLSATATEHDSLTATHSAVVAERDGFKTTSDQATAALTAANSRIAELEKQVETTEADVERRAGLRSQEILASVGAPPVATAPASVTATLSLREHYDALKDHRERAQFWAKHRNEILT